MIKKILLALLGFFVAIQLIPFDKDHSNPAVVAEPRWDSPRTKELFDRACADCHSHQTEWPFYSHIAPFSWLIQYDVDEGREHFNVSMWGVQEENEGKEAAHEVREGEMPPWFYLPTHPQANLNKQEKAELIRGLVRTFGDED